MKNRLVLLALLALLVGGPGATAQEKEGADAALARVMAEAKVEAAKLRGLEFTKEIPIRKMTKDEFMKQMLRDIRRIFGEGNALTHMETLLRELRILPPETGVLDLTEDFFPETVAANYDPFEKRISFLKTYRSPGTMKSIMVHELTHALQDQHFGISSMVLSGEMTFDRLLALGGLMEGDAESVQRTYDTKGFLAVTPIETIRAIGKNEVRKYLERMKDFPRGIARPFIFQYLDGLLFVETVKRAGGGYDAVNEMYDDPPTTTEQVLHPERYLERDLPVRILPPEPPEGYRVLVSNVLGELGVSIVLTANLGADLDPKAAEGWDGDRVLLLKAGEAEPVIAWYTAWDTKEDAEEFAAAAAEMLEARHPEGVRGEPQDGTVLRVAEGTTHAVVVREREALLVMGMPSDDFPAILEKLETAVIEEVVIGRSVFGEPR